MLLALLEWALWVIIAAIVVLLFSWLADAVWNAVLAIFRGPQLSYFEMALIVAIVSVGTRTFSILQPRTAS